MNCQYCKVAYSFVFMTQFHAKDCPMVSPVKPRAPYTSELAREILGRPYG